MTGVRVEPVGDSCLSVVFEAASEPAVNARCLAVAAELRQRRGGGVLDVVPGFHTVAIYFDPFAVERERLINDVRAVALSVHPDVSSEGVPVEIAVRYGGADG